MIEKVFVNQVDYSQKRIWSKNTSTFWNVALLFKWCHLMAL